MTIDYKITNFQWAYKDLVFKTPNEAHGYSCVTIEQPSTAAGGVTLPIGAIVSYDSATNKYTQSVNADIAANKVFGVVLDGIVAHPTEFKTGRVAKAGTSHLWVLNLDVIVEAFPTTMLAAERNALIAFLETKNIRITRG